MTKTPDYKGFTAKVMRSWGSDNFFDIDCCELHDVAIEFGVLHEVSGGFNPELHECPYAMSEAGDPWYILDKDVRG